MNQAEKQIMAGKLLFLVLLGFAVLIQVLTIFVSYQQFGMTEIGLLLIILVFQCAMMFVAYKGNQRVKLYLGVIFLASAMYGFKYWSVFANEPFYRWFRVVTGVISGAIGIIILSSTRITEFINSQSSKRTK